MLIDERGRLFGKINVIDFIVLLFVLCLTPSLWFGYKIMTREVEVEIKPPTITLDKVEYEQEREEYRKALKRIKNFLKEHKGARKYFDLPQHYNRLLIETREDFE